VIEGVNWVAVGGFLLLAIERVVYYRSRYRRRNNPGTTDGVLKLLEKHEEMDEKRHDETKGMIEQIRENQTDYEARLRVLESQQQ